MDRQDPASDCRSATVDQNDCQQRQQYNASRLKDYRSDMLKQQLATDAISQHWSCERPDQKEILWSLFGEPSLSRR